MPANRDGVLGTDDWTTMNDPITKKRIQNRVAQRNYRSRVRSRLKELEKQVQEQQLKPSSNPAITGNIDISGNTAAGSNASNSVCVSSQDVPELQPDTCRHHAGHGSSSQAQIQPLDWANLSAQELPIMDYGDMSFTPGLIEGMHENSDAYPTGPFTDSWQEHFEQDAAVSHVESSRGHGSQEIGARGSVSRASHLKSRTSDLSPEPSPTISNQNLDRANTDDGASVTLSVPGKDATRERQIEFVLSCVNRAGFDSLESFVIAFYTSDFDDASSLFFEQRMSRNRRLPLVMAELRKLVPSWTRWESSGYENEILRAAEEICVAECRGFSLQDATSIMQNASSRIEGTQSIQPKILQQRLPHLSALLTSLISNTTSPSRFGDTNITTICLLLLSCSGSVETPHTASLLHTCLSFVKKHATTSQRRGNHTLNDEQDNNIGL